MARYLQTQIEHLKAIKLGQTVAVNAIQETKNKTASAIFQQGSTCCHNLLTIPQRYQSKATPIRTLHTDEITEAVLLFVFTIAFPASLLSGPNKV